MEADRDEDRIGVRTLSERWRDKWFVADTRPAILKALL